MAKQWKATPDQVKCSHSAGGSGSVLIQGKSSQKSVLEVTECEAKYMEHVQAHVTLAASKRGDVQIALTSPSGTRSLLIAKRPKDYSRAGFNNWPFLTVILMFSVKCNEFLQCFV